MLLGTHRVAETTNSNCNRLFIRKKVTRKTAPTTLELQTRSRFAAVAAAVAERANDLQYKSQDRTAYLAQKDQAGGKKSMKSYLWKVCGDIYDAQHQG